jgi:hypothetical protein
MPDLDFYENTSRAAFRVWLVFFGFPTNTATERSSKQRCVCVEMEIMHHLMLDMDFLTIPDVCCTGIYAPSDAGVSLYSAGVA